MRLSQAIQALQLLDHGLRKEGMPDADYDEIRLTQWLVSLKLNDKTLKVPLVERSTLPGANPWPNSRS